MKVDFLYTFAAQCKCEFITETEFVPSCLWYFLPSLSLCLCTHKCFICDDHCHHQHQCCCCCCCWKKEKEVVFRFGRKLFSLSLSSLSLFVFCRLCVCVLASAISARSRIALLIMSLVVCLFVCYTKDLGRDTFCSASTTYSSVWKHCAHSALCALVQGRNVTLGTLGRVSELLFFFFFFCLLFPFEFHWCWCSWKVFFTKHQQFS